MKIQLKIRSVKGQQILNTLEETSTYLQLITEITKLVAIQPETFIIKVGYPPKFLDIQNVNSTLAELNISSGETLVIEDKPIVFIQKPLPEKQQPLQQPSQQQLQIQQQPPKQAQNQNKNKNNQIQNFEQQVQKSLAKEQTPNAEGLIMIRKIIPSDNSCLFNSVAYALEKKQMNLTDELRNIIAGIVMSDPQKYNSVLLGKANDEYCEWILKDTSWGGEIELMILAEYYNCEICAISIQTLANFTYGANNNYTQRIYLMYDGIHYDAIVQNISEDMPEDISITVFQPSDSFAFSGALVLANQLKLKKQYTDTANFSIQCGVCYECFVGENQAVEHSKKTGHQNFQEVNQNLKK